MRTTLINTILCFLIVLLGITLSSGASTDNDEYAPANIDWIDFDTYYPAQQIDTRAAKSRFWKRAQHRKFWKRSLAQSAMNDNNMVQSVSNQEKH